MCDPVTLSGWLGSKPEKWKRISGWPFSRYSPSTTVISRSCMFQWAAFRPG